jgi:hypothetical protein
MSESVDELLNARDGYSVTLLDEEGMLALLDLDKWDETDRTNDHVCLQMDCAWIDWNEGREPTEVSVSIASGMFPAFSHVAKAFLAEGAPDRPGKRVGCVDNRQLDMSTHEEVLPIDDTLVIGELDACVEFVLRDQGFPGGFRTKAKWQG